MFTILRFQFRVPVVADRHDIGKPGISRSETQIDNTETGTREYSLEYLRTYINTICREFQIENFVAFFGAHFEVPEPLPMTDRRKVLSNDDRFCRNFLEEESYNISIIDMDTNSEYEHRIMTTYIANSLVDSSPKSGSMLIHIYCHEKVEMMTPFCLTSALLRFLWICYLLIRSETVFPSKSVIKQHKIKRSIMTLPCSSWKRRFLCFSKSIRKKQCTLYSATCTRATWMRTIDSLYHVS